MSKRGKPTVFSDQLLDCINKKPELLQENLASLVDISQGTMSNYMTGASFPSKAVAQALGIQLDCDLMETWEQVRQQRKQEQAKKRLEKRTKGNSRANNLEPQLLKLYRAMREQTRRILVDYANFLSKQESNISFDNVEEVEKWENAIRKPWHSPGRQPSSPNNNQNSTRGGQKVERPARQPRVRPEKTLPPESHELQPGKKGPR